MRPQQSMQQASRVENYISNNQIYEEFDLMSGSKYEFDAHTIFYPYALKVIKLKKVRSLKLLLVVFYRRMHTALPVPSEKALAISVQSHNCSSSSIMQLSSPDMLMWQF